MEQERKAGVRRRVWGPGAPPCEGCAQQEKCGQLRYCSRWERWFRRAWRTVCEPLRGDV